MKRSLTLLALGAALSVGAAAFQKANTVAVPFDFSINGQSFPAGVYTVQRLTNTGVLMLRAADGRAFAVSTERIGAYHGDRGAHALFYSAGGKKQVLQEVWTGDSGQGYRIRAVK